MRSRGTQSSAPRCPPWPPYSKRSPPDLASPYLTADVEGLTIYKPGHGTGYLLVSSQGSHEFLGGDVTQGLLVAHDGGDTPDVLDEEDEKRDNTNFKFVRWADVAHAMGLQIDTTDRVRKPHADLAHEWHR